MKHFLRLSVVMALCLCAAVFPACAETQFFSSIQDIPLMPGLEELSEQTVVFDKPEGRITETVAAMDGVSPAQVQGYYESSLPSFGWAKISENSFVRGEERLSLLFEEIDGHQFLRVMIAPE